MAITAKNEGGNFEITPAGNHVARVIGIVHIGTIPETYMGEEKEMNKVRITFELPHETKEFKEGEGQKPFLISQEYTVSMNEKAKLRQLVEGMYGVGLPEEEQQMFDVTKLMSKVCMINILHKTSKSGNQYAVISSAAPLPKGMEEPAQVNESTLFDYEENFSEEFVERQPEFIRNKIKSSAEYKAKTGQTQEDIEYPSEEEVPFSS